MKKKIIASVCALFLAAFLLWQNNSLTVSEYSFAFADLPAGFDGLKIVQLSDLHNKNFHGSLTRRVSELEPDIIVITGDLIDSRKTDYEAAVGFVDEISDIAPIYYVSGNHEQKKDEKQEFFTALSEHGVTVLQGETVSFKRGDDEICIAGLNDLSFYGSSVLGENKLKLQAELDALSQKKQDSFGILLSHRPELFDCYVESGFDIVFAGHTHGGQIRLPIIGGIFAPGQGFLPKYDAGVYENGKTKMIISRGLGNSVFPFRVFDRPEIVVCKLERDK